MERPFWGYISGEAAQQLSFFSPIMQNKMQLV